MWVNPKAGDEVLYHPYPVDQLNLGGPARPLVAKVAYVHHERLVNLSVLDANGNWHSTISVELWQHGSSPGHVDKPDQMKPQDGYCDYPHARGPSEMGVRDSVSSDTLSRRRASEAEQGKPNARAMVQAEHVKEPAVQATARHGVGTVAKVTGAANPGMEPQRAGIDDVESKKGSAPVQEG
jgi:hypothetical protein